MSKKIALTRGFSAIIDDDDYERIACYKWTYRGDGYAVRSDPQSRGKHILMHRYLLDAPPDILVDHANHNTLDNRRTNIRLCPTRRHNQQNLLPRINKRTSQYKGVGARRHGKWRMSIKTPNGSIAHYYPTEVEAALAYDYLARQHFGAFAYTNFPPDYRPDYVPLLPTATDRKLSKYKGVVKSINRWKAVVRIAGHDFHIGQYVTEIKAFAAVCEVMLRFGLPAPPLPSEPIPSQIK